MPDAADQSNQKPKSSNRGGFRPGSGRKAKDPAIKAAAEAAVQAARASRYDSGLCAYVEQVMGAGYSLGAFAGKVGVSRSAITLWMGEHPEFAEAVARAKCARLVHWEDRAMRVAERGGGPGTAQIIQFGLKNMGAEDWSDKQTIEHTGDGGGPVKIAITPIPAGMFFDADGKLMKDDGA